jgi:small subunit ribosomal protein S26e
MKSRAVTDSIWAVSPVWSILSLMPKKRRNGGRGKMNSGRKQTVNCLNCGKLVPRDKAIKRFTIKNIVDASSLKDVQEATIYADYDLPKQYQKTFYCVSCAVHRRVVRVRRHDLRRVRVPLFLKLQRERQESREHAASAHREQPKEEAAAPK